MARPHVLTTYTLHLRLCIPQFPVHMSCPHAHFYVSLPIVHCPGEFDLADASCCGNGGSDDPSHTELKKRKTSRLLLQDTARASNQAGSASSRHLLAGCPAPGNNNPDGPTLIGVN